MSAYIAAVQAAQILRLSAAGGARRQALVCCCEAHSHPGRLRVPAALPCAQGSSPDTHFGLAQAFSAGTYPTTPNASAEPMYRTVSASTVSGSGSVEVYHRQLSAELAASAAQVRVKPSATLPCCVPPAPQRQLKGCPHRRQRRAGAPQARPLPPPLLLSSCSQAPSASLRWGSPLLAARRARCKPNGSASPSCSQPPERQLSVGLAAISTVQASAKPRAPQCLANRTCRLPVFSSPRWTAQPCACALQR